MELCTYCSRQSLGACSSEESTFVQGHTSQALLGKKTEGAQSASLLETKEGIADQKMQRHESISPEKLTWPCV